MTWIKCYRHGLGGDLAFRFVDDSPLEEDGFEPSVPPEKRTHLVEMFDRSSTSLSERDRGFESVFLQRRVSDEPVPRRLASIARSPSPRDVPPTCKWPAEKPRGLTESQQQRVTAIFEPMSAAAKPLGSEVIAREQALDQLFAKGEITPDRLTAETAAIGELQGRLRSVHLSAH